MFNNENSEQNDELYQEILLDHNKNPRNFGKLACANRVADGINPLCGDQIQLYLQVDGDIIKDISFECSGCAISKASASVLGEAVKGKTTKEALALFETFRNLVTRDAVQTVDGADLGDLAAFSGVRAFPIRIKCAVLAWHALQAALKGEAKRVSTEE